jgi:type VI secretion system protein ImpL
VIDGFYQRHLAPYADTLGRDAMLPFQRAQAIRDAFFADGGKRVNMKLELRLLELEPGVAEFLLDVDGQALRFRRDSKAPQTLLWPGPGAGRVQLQMSGGTPYAFEGPWSLLRVFDRVRIEPGSGGRFQLVFDVEGRKARFEARSTHALNPAQREELEQFKCPSRL